MTKYLPVVITVLGTISAAVFTPQFLETPKGMEIFAALNVAAQILHAVLPSVSAPPAAAAK
jgi:hypothetical protein